MEEEVCDLVGLSEEAVLLHSNGESGECICRMKALQRHLNNTDRWALEPTVMYNICGLLQGEVSKWEQDEDSIPLMDSLGVAAAALNALKNAFPHCSRNQLLVAESKELLDPIISCTKWTFLSNSQSARTSRDEKHPKNNDARIKEDTQEKPDIANFRQSRMEGVVADTPDDEWQAVHSHLALACIMCIGNIVAANTTTRTVIWPHILPLLGYLLGYRECESSQAASMVLHNCLMEEPLRTLLFRSDGVNGIIRQLLSLYINEGRFACFVLLCLESLLNADHTVQHCWSELNGTQRLLALDVLITILEKSPSSCSRPLTHSTVAFISGIFKSEADKILCTSAGELDQDDSQVLARVLRFVCFAAAADSWRSLLQEDTSLLITSVYLLRCMGDIGRKGGNAFTPLSRLSDLNDEEQMSSAIDHPAFGFKCDLIRLIASLVYHHRDNQDKVRDIGGLTLMLESSQFDARNPLIKETSVFALRNLLEGNVENQESIRSLTLRGMEDNASLRDLGMAAVVEDGRVKLIQRTPSLPEEEEEK